MKFFHHMTYLIGCTVTFICLFVVEVVVLSPVLQSLLPSSLFWIYYVLVFLLAMTLNPMLTWLVGQRISQRFYNEP